MKKITNLSFASIIASLVLLGAGCAPSSTPAQQNKPSDNTPKTTTPTPEVPNVVPPAPKCNDEVIRCKDGSFLGRIPPACDFAKCPEIDNGTTFNTDSTSPSAPAPTPAPTTPAPTPKPTPTPAPVPTPVNVSISNFSFQPATITVSVGTKITWTNNDSAPHNVVADDGSFSSNTLTKGGTFSYTFTKAGTYNYICTIHPSMKGTVIVK